MKTLIIVGAGDGGRMGGVLKCMLLIGGRPLLEHIVDLFNDYRIVFVGGYEYKDLQNYWEGAVKSTGRRPIEFIENPQWEETNSAYSLQIALQTLQPDDDVVVIDSDLYFNFIPKERGFYCSPFNESILYPDCEIGDCLGWFRGIARLTAQDCRNYMSAFNSSHIKKYWCNVLYPIAPVITNEKIVEFDTWEDYHAFNS